MAETKWTPGPWEVVGADSRECWIGTAHDRIKDTSYRNLACAINTASAGSHKANAHLIAAAPALYEALEGLRQEIEYIAAKRSYAAGLGASEWEGFLTAKERVAWEASVTALAQARGESTKEDDHA